MVFQDGDNTTFHLWNKMTNWILENLGNENMREAGQACKAAKSILTRNVRIDVRRT